MASIRPQKKHGNDRWCVDYKDGRGKRHQRFFADPDKAQAFYRQVSSPEKSGPSWTTDNLVNSYLSESAGQRSEESQSRMMERGGRVLKALSAIGIHYLSQVDRQTWPRLVDYYRKQEYSEYTITGRLSVWKAACRYGVERGVLNERDLGRMKLAEPQKRLRKALTSAQVDFLLDYLSNHWLRLPCALAAFQGLRRREVIELDCGDVDLAEQTITVKRSKNKDWRVVRFHPRLPEFLPHDLPTNGQPLCTCKGSRVKKQTISTVFWRITNRLQEEHGEEWEGVKFHTLRHTCATLMAKSGKFTLYQIAKVLGHKDISTTQRYAHLMPDEVVPSW